MVRIGSLFAGIGGFELGLERAIPQSTTVFQVEQNKFCQSILKKHWPDAVIFDDVCTVGSHNLPQYDLLCGGFPCQSISNAGQKRGLKDAKKSGLWFEMLRVIGDSRPRVVCLENVANILRLGGPDVIGGLAKIGYDCEWTVIRAKDFGAPHQRARWFCVAWDTTTDTDGIRPSQTGYRRFTQTIVQRGYTFKGGSQTSNVANTDGIRLQTGQTESVRLQSKSTGVQSINAEYGNVTRDDRGGNYWGKFPTQSPVCRRNDGLPNRVDRVRALGNAIVPQCSEWVGKHILQSGLLDDLYT
jgi:DNA (cytosine-5)-methyltransferase 1